MFKKAKFTPIHYLIAVWLLLATYFLIIAINSSGLNLAPLFALLSFVFAGVLFFTSLIIRYFYKDLRKIVIAETVVLAVLFIPTGIYLILIYLELIGML